MGLDGVAQSFDPGLNVRAEETPLSLEIADRDVVAGNQVAHHLEHEGNVVLGLARAQASRVRPSSCSSWRNCASGRSLRNPLR